VKYLNARPLIHGWEGKVVLDHPSALCAQLAAATLDVALVSSFEFLRNPIYRIVDTVSISSDGPVYSVVLAYRGKLADVKEIALDPASQTSGNLLRCLLDEISLTPRIVSTASKESAKLLIGDQAIRFRQRFTGDFHFWDLGEQWRQAVRLPFVYALWLIRPEVENAGVIANRLRGLRDRNISQLDELIAREKEFDRAFCDRYYREHIRFNLGKNEKQGLHRFAELCQEHDLLPKRDLVLNAV
jgi:chorismate dehydratase